MMKLRRSKRRARRTHSHMISAQAMMNTALMYSIAGGHGGCSLANAAISGIVASAAASASTLSRSLK